MPGARPGRPKKITSDASLRRTVQAYFDKCEEGRTVPIITRKGIVGEIVECIPITIEGILGELGIGWTTWGRYCHDDEFRETIVWARGVVRADIVRRGLEGESPPGIVQLLLRAMDRDRYADRRIVKQRFTVHDGDAPLDPDTLTDAQLAAIATGRAKGRLTGDDGE